jgi:hypothetical protein
MPYHIIRYNKKQHEAEKKNTPTAFSPIHPHDHEPTPPALHCSSPPTPRSPQRQHPVGAPCGRRNEFLPPTRSPAHRRPVLSSVAVPCSSMLPDLPPRAAGPRPRAPPDLAPARRRPDLAPASRRPDLVTRAGPGTTEYPFPSPAPSSLLSSTHTHQRFYRPLLPANAAVLIPEHNSRELPP